MRGAPAGAGVADAFRDRQVACRRQLGDRVREDIGAAAGQVDARQFERYRRRAAQQRDACRPRRAVRGSLDMAWRSAPACRCRSDSRARRLTPFSIKVQMISASERKPYIEPPKVQCGPPNSAVRLHSGCTASPARRYRFHQPLRSDTKCSTPAGDHSGWQIDSSGPPATRRAFDRAPASSRSASHSSVPCHGMRGWSQHSHASGVPSGDSRGAA